VSIYVTSGVAWSYIVTLEKPEGTPWTIDAGASVDGRILNAFRRPISATVTDLSFSGTDVTVVFAATETAKIRWYHNDESERPIEVELVAHGGALAQSEVFFHQVRCRKGTVTV
jgi:hypothetical protein